jgi:hypothetical protein
LTGAALSGNRAGIEVAELLMGAVCSKNMPSGPNVRFAEIQAAEMSDWFWPVAPISEQAR